MCQCELLVSATVILAFLWRSSRTNLALDQTLARTPSAAASPTGPRRPLKRFSTCPHFGNFVNFALRRRKLCIKVHLDGVYRTTPVPPKSLAAVVESSYSTREVLISIAQSAEEISRLLLDRSTSRSKSLTGFSSYTLTSILTWSVAVDTVFESSKGGVCSTQNLMLRSHKCV